MRSVTFLVFAQVCSVDERADDKKDTAAAVEEEDNRLGLMETVAPEEEEKTVEVGESQVT